MVGAEADAHLEAEFAESQGAGDAPGRRGACPPLRQLAFEFTSGFGGEGKRRSTAAGTLASPAFPRGDSSSEIVFVYLYLGFLRAVTEIR